MPARRTWVFNHKYPIQVRHHFFLTEELKKTAITLVHDHTR